MDTNITKSYNNSDSEPSEEERDINAIMYKNFLENQDCPCFYLNLFDDQFTFIEIKFVTYEGIYFYFLAQEKDQLKKRIIAPFYFITSFQLDDLYENNNIFKACDSLEEIKKHFISLFKNKKVTLFLGKRKENEKQVLLIRMNCKLFCSPWEICFELEKKMIPSSQKNKKLLEMYLVEKKEALLLNKIYLLIKKKYEKIKSSKNPRSGENKEDIILIEKILLAYKNSKFPGMNIDEDLGDISLSNEKMKSNEKLTDPIIEGSKKKNQENKNEFFDLNKIKEERKKNKSTPEENEKDKNKESFNYLQMESDSKKETMNFQLFNLKNFYEFNIEKNASRLIEIKIINKSEIVWPNNNTFLICNGIKSKQIENIIYDCDINEDIDFIIEVQEKEVGVYPCSFYLKIEDKIYENHQGNQFDIIIYNNKIEEECENVRLKNPKEYNEKRKNGILNKLIKKYNA